MTPLEPQIAAIASIANASPGKAVGRTALMKCCYLLQVLRHVPLGFRFTLYSYGPFDKEVLAKLGEAEALGVIEETLVQYPGTYGYEIRSVFSDRQLAEAAPQFFDLHRKDIEAIVGEFGGKTAAELELIATAIFADRESAAAGGDLGTDALVRTVAAIKPKFEEDGIRRVVSDLKRAGHLAGPRV